MSEGVTRPWEQRRQMDTVRYRSDLAKAEAEPLSSPETVSALTRHLEAEAVYRAEARVKAGYAVAEASREAITKLDARITGSSAGNPYLESLLRRHLQEPFAYCASELIAREMGRRS